MTNTTITDKDNYKISKIIDIERYDKLDLDQQELFEYIRNSLLEIFPLTDKNIHDDDCLKFCENHAFILLNGFNSFYEKKIKTKLDAFELSITEKINNLTTTTTTE